jgi:hypothetical protein
MHHKKSHLRGRNGSSCDPEMIRDDAEKGGSYLAVRKSTVAGWAVPLTACSGNASWKCALLLHRAVVERYPISIVLKKTRSDDEIAK